MKWGEGQAVYRNKARYEGHFEKDKRHGFGRMWYDNAGTYEVRFVVRVRPCACGGAEATRRAQVEPASFMIPRHARLFWRRVTARLQPMHRQETQASLTPQTMHEQTMRRNQTCRVCKCSSCDARCTHDLSTNAQREAISLLAYAPISLTATLPPQIERRSNFRRGDTCLSCWAAVMWA